MGPKTGKVFSKLLTIWESQTFNWVQDAFQHLETICNISYFYLCVVFCFSHDQRQIHMYRLRRILIKNFLKVYFRAVH